MIEDVEARCKRNFIFLCLPIKIEFPFFHVHRQMHKQLCYCRQNNLA